MSDFIQFELWKDCNVGCPFCFNRFQQPVDKLKMLDFVADKLISDEVDNNIDFGLIGGEFFDNQLKDATVKEKFYNLFPIIKEKINQGKIGRLLIATSLVFDRNKELVNFLKHLESLDLIKSTVLCTSYDSIYRFRNDKMKTLWENNMLFLKSNYPSLRLHTEIIITKKFMEDVLSGDFNILAFREKYKTAIDYIDPMADMKNYPKEKVMKDLPEFFPSVDLFISFLNYAYQNSLVDFSTFLKMDIRSNHTYINYNGKLVLQDNRRSNDNWADEMLSFGFIDSDKKMREVVDEFLDCME